MARITAKQAKEMNEAYAKVYQNLQEESESTRIRREKIAQMQKEKEAGGLNKLVKKEAGVEGQSFKKGAEMSNPNITPSSKIANNNKSNNQTTQKPVAQNNNQQTNNTSSSGNSGGLTTLSGRPSRLSTYAQQKVLAMKKDANTAGVKPNEGSSTVSNVNSTGTAQKVGNQSSSAPNGSGGRRKIEPGTIGKLLPNHPGNPANKGNQTAQEPGVKTSRTVVKDGNRTTTTTKRSADDSTPEGAAAVNKEKAAFADRMAARRSARDGNTGGGGQAPQGGGQQKTVRGQGNRERPVKTGGIQVGKSIKGGLSRLGSLAGKAVAGARNVASNVKQGVQSAASNVKQGAQAVAGALANKGPIQGRQTGAQRRAQQSQIRADRPAPVTPTGPIRGQGNRPIAGNQNRQGGTTPVAKPVATRPVQGQQPAAKPVVTQQPAAKPAPQQAQPTYKTRIGAFLNNSKKGAVKKPSRHTKVTSVMDMEGYDPMENLFDDTVQFLVSEGHAKDKSEAISIMSESEFMDAFNQELNG